MRIMGQNREDRLRLNVFVARASGLSRRAADGEVVAGNVAVDGITVREPGFRVNPGQKIFLNGKEIELPDRFIWLILNKPTGYISTRSDPHGRRTVMDLLPEKYRTLFPVGRLDTDTTGLLLFTNDGKTANNLLHPRYSVPRVYRARIAGKLDEEVLSFVKRGVMVDGRRVFPESLCKLYTREDSEVWEIRLVHGRYHEVKRFFSALGKVVVSLKRLSYAGIELEHLAKGEFRELTRREIAEMKTRLESYG